MSDKKEIFVKRYITPNDYRFERDRESDDKYFDHPNLYGVTILYRLDYENDTVEAQYSVCNGDNFSKEVGISRAGLNPMTYVFPLDTVEDHAGLNNAFLSNICDTYGKFIDYECFEDILKLFRYASMRESQR